MSILISSKTVTPGHQATFTFDTENCIKSYIVGISHWQLQYDKSDHQTKQIELNINVSDDGKQTVYATPNAILSGQGHGLDLDYSAVSLVCIAAFDDDDRDYVLKQANGIVNNESSSSIATPDPHDIDIAVLNGWNMTYPNAAHHVQVFTAGAKANPGGASTTIKSSAVMHDHPTQFTSEHYASHPTVDSGLVATPTDLPLGLLYCTFDNRQQSNSDNLSQTFEVPNGLKDVGVMLTNFQASFDSDTDHDIKNIGGGTSGWNVSGNTVTLNDAKAFMSDGKHSQNDSTSYVSVVVFAVPN